MLKLFFAQSLEVAKLHNQLGAKRSVVLDMAREATKLARLVDEEATRQIRAAHQAGRVPPLLLVSQVRVSSAAGRTEWSHDIGLADRAPAGFVGVIYTLTPEGVAMALGST